jgi:hypothetical protein
VGERTKKRYGADFKQWLKYRTQHGLSQWVDVGAGEDACAQEIATYAAYLFATTGVKAATISGKIAAISKVHKDEGKGTLPTTHNWLRDVKRGIERRQGEAGKNVKAVRKPISWEMVMRGRECHELWAQVPGGLLVWFGLAVEYIFMLRAEELWGQSSGPGRGQLRPANGITRGDLEFRANGVPLQRENWRDAQVVVVHQRASKGDPMREGRQTSRQGDAARVLLDMLSLHPDMPWEAPLTAYHCGGG